MRVIAWFAVVAVGLLAPAQSSSKTDGPDKLRVLIVTGHDVSAHDWRATTPVLREHLEATGRFEVKVSEEPLVLESSALDGYDAVVLNYYNAELPSITDRARENLVGFVRKGKGLVSFHYTCRAFQDWPEFRDLIGRIWTPAAGSGHGPRGLFKATIADPNHFITEGLTGFYADDELYAKLTGSADIHVLVEARSEWSGRVEPIAWTLDYGRGRVFNVVLGHDVRACRNPAFARLLQRGTTWAARGDAD